MNVSPIFSSMKRFLLLILAVATFSGAVADEVTPSAALRIAEQVLGGDVTRSSELAVAWDSSILGTTRNSDSTPTFYVVAPECGEGFVIVAGDDVFPPVLAYSTTYSAPMEDGMPENFEAWLRYVDRVVRYAREHGLEANEATARKWSEGYTPVDAIMLNTARWSQGWPYNMYCPMDGDVNSLTGCTQTAIAEIMHYYRWPMAAMGSTEPFTTTTKGIAVGSRDLNHAYDWDNMLDEYVEDGFNMAEAEAVAVLMADLGHSNKADYSAEGTGALPDIMAMYVNYGYSPACHYAMRDSYTVDGWNAAMRMEIESSRPVLYSAYTPDEFGHAFVLDGVDDNDYFHVNWGWGGAFDGFFLLDDLAVDVYVFSDMHWAFLGLHPVRDGEADNLLYLAAPGIIIPETEFAQNVPFVIQDISVANVSMLSFKGEVRVGVCDSDGEFKSWATEPCRIELESNYMSYCGTMEALIADEIAAGDCLRVYYRSDGSERWFAMIPYSDYTTYEVVLRYPRIGDTTSIEYDRKSGIMCVVYDDDVKSALYLDGEYVTQGVDIAKGRMTIDTRQLLRDREYTIYLERKDVESKTVVFKLNEL